MNIREFKEMLKRLRINYLLQSRLRTNRLLLSQYVNLASQNRLYGATIQYGRRQLSSTQESAATHENSEKKNSKAMSEFDYDNYEDYEPQTAGEQVL